MTVTVVPVNDPKAPDLKQSTSLGGFFKKLLLRAFLFSLGLNVLVGIFNKFSGFIPGFITVFIFSAMVMTTFASYKVRLTQNRKPFLTVHEYYKAHAVDNGLVVNFENPGILVDTNAKKIVFTIDPFAQHQYLICDYQDIQAWDIHRDDITQNNPIHVNMNTGQVRGGPQHLMTAHMVTVNINYPESPRQMFWTGNDADSGLWSARLNSLVNG